MIPQYVQLTNTPKTIAGVHPGSRKKYNGSIGEAVRASTEINAAGCLLLCSTDAVCLQLNWHRGLNYLSDHKLASG